MEKQLIIDALIIACKDLQFLMKETGSMISDGHADEAYRITCEELDPLNKRIERLQNKLESCTA